ncbi:hypothetical protein [Bifidobacterium adolescentis]|uniref:VG15 protein n=1 Tax=Bifidobacterium adolescentis TaxID=1680 RepID=UPI00138E3DD3|nr:hypothetical protein [Bifidobacterium adolescentis]
MAIREMRSLWTTAQDLNAEWQLDLLLDAVPRLVAKYGDVAAAAAAEWYERQRAEYGPSDSEESYRAITADSFRDEAIRAAMQSQSSLLSSDPQQLASWLEQAITRWVHYSGRQTIANNVIRDPSKPHWARVPRGAKTCAFCLVLCSQGFVYRSEDTATFAHGSIDKYHNDCDCEAIASWDADESIIKGYDPDRLYDQYAEARDMIASGNIPEEWREQMKAAGIKTDSMYDPHALAFLIRRTCPGSVRDGVKGD